MGGIGYITAFHADIARNSAMINIHMLEAARINAAKRFLFSSSACVYPMYLQKSPDVTNLKEDDAYPAEPEEGYGTEKLFMEELCKYYNEDYDFQTRVVRFHNVYGPLGTYEGGKEKAPAAISRKVALATDGDEIEVWGDGEQTRSFMHVEDCVEGIYRIMRSEYPHPLNLGTDELVTINELVEMVAEISEQAHHQAPRSLQAARGAGSKQRQQQTPRGARLGAPDPAEGRSDAYLPLDRIGAQDRRKGPPARLEQLVAKALRPFRFAIRQSPTSQPSRVLQPRPRGPVR